MRALSFLDLDTPILEGAHNKKPTKAKIT